LLIGAAGSACGATLTAGCSDDGAAADRKRVHAAHTLRERAARDSEVLLVRYDSTAAAHPDLAEDLHPLRSHVERHLKAFRGESRKSGHARGGNRIAVPPDPATALQALAAAETRTADTRTRALADAPPELARLLASVAASGAVHARLLKERAA
jgi:hypothetical protein